MSDLSKLRVLLTDEVHFHNRNFNSLFLFFEKYKVQVTNAKAPSDWIALYGNYFAKSNNLRKTVLELSFLKKSSLAVYSYKGISVFECCKLEFLSYVIGKPSWRNLDLTSDIDDLFNLAFEIEYDALLHNMAAVVFWIDWWEKKIQHLPHQNYACIFSGSLIYSDVLIKILKKHVAEPIVLESFFTGNEYYCEKKYQHIPNNSDLRFDTYYQSIQDDFESFEYDRNRVKAINKILLSKNKNVEQPKVESAINFENKEKIFVILGQVLNDFSVLGGSGRINSLFHYKELIRNIISQTDLNVVFKAHPWENKKIGLNAPVTKLELENYSSEFFTVDQQSRFMIVEDYNLSFLLEQSDYVSTLCSQSAIEAAFLGMKPIQFGNAFFGGKGFTSDYYSIDDFMHDFKAGAVKNTLSLEEFDLFERFCVKSLCKHLVSVHASGLVTLREIFTLDDSIKIASPAALPIKKPKIVPEKLAEPSKVVSESINQANDDNVRVVLDKQSRRQKLWNKFRTDPYAYFNDSRNKYERLLRFLFRRKS